MDTSHKTEHQKTFYPTLIVNATTDNIHPRQTLLWAKASSLCAIMRINEKYKPITSQNFSVWIVLLSNYELIQAIGFHSFVRRSCVSIVWGSHPVPSPFTAHWRLAWQLIRLAAASLGYSAAEETAAGHSRSYSSVSPLSHDGDFHGRRPVTMPFTQLVYE